MLQAAAAAVTGDGGITDKERIGKSMDKRREWWRRRWKVDIRSFSSRVFELLNPFKVRFHNEFMFYTLKDSNMYHFFFEIFCEKDWKCWNTIIALLYFSLEPKGKMAQRFEDKLRKNGVRELISIHEKFTMIYYVRTLTTTALYSILMFDQSQFVRASQI